MKTVSKASSIEDKIDSVWTFVLGAVFVLQIIWIIWSNLFQLKYRLGFDASSYLLQSMEIVKQGTLFISDWEYTTSLFWDSTVPLAALIYQLTGKLFLSWGWANLIMLAAVLTAYQVLLSHYIGRLQGRLVALNLSIGTYCLVDHYGYGLISNDLGYAAMMFLSASMYAFKMLTFLMVAVSVLDMEKGRREPVHIFRYISTIALIFVTGLSSGTYILFIAILPAAGCLMLKILIANDFRRVKLPGVLYIIGCGLVNLAGKKLAAVCFGFSARDSGMNWCGHEQFWQNLGLFLTGYPQALTAVSPKSDIPIFSRTGIFMCAGIAIVGFTVAGCIYFFRKAAKERGGQDSDLLLASILLMNTAVLVLSYSIYPGQESHFQIRYLIPLMLGYFICVGMWVDHLNRQYIASHVCCLALIASIAAMDLKSDHTYSSTKTNYDQLVQLSNIVGEYSDTKVVYFYGSQPETQVASRNMRVIDASRIYKQVMDNGSFLHWGDYTCYDHPEDYPGEVLVICQSGHLNGTLEWMAGCEYLGTFEGWDMYRMGENRIYPL
ncbi:MAG: hypothetical protein ACI4D5_06810 [Kineothrix sp.]